MKRRHKPFSEPNRSKIDELLAAMDAAELREVVRDVLLELDDPAHTRAVTSLIERAARGKAGWAPTAPGREEIAEVVAFARAAQRVGYADSSDVDEYLSRGTAAFFRKDYSTAREIFGALLRPLAEGEIDLGQDEMVDEVLGVEPSMCAARYVVSIYMTSKPEQRADEVVRRMEGTGGLEKIARSTRRAEDLRAWCESLVETGDWKAALAALEEAAQLVTVKEHGQASSWTAPRWLHSSWAGKTCRRGSSGRGAQHQACCGCVAGSGLRFRVTVWTSTNPSPEASRWAATVRQEYRRYPALRAELEERLGSS